MDHLNNSAPEQRAVTPAVDYAALRESHYQAALDAGKKLNDAKLANKRMKDIRFLESQHQQAWSRVYAMDAIIRERAFQDRRRLAESGREVQILVEALFR